MFKFIDKIFGLVRQIFSWVDLVEDAYSKVEKAVPGLIAFIEALYGQFKEKIDNEVMTSGEAREELLKEAEGQFTNSPIIVPRAFLRYVLELVHMKNNLESVRVYDDAEIKLRAHRVLTGLKNKYGDR